MIHQSVSRPCEWHSAHCDCPTCEPYVPSQPATLGTGRIAFSILLGVANGLLIAWLVDHLTGGPGLLVMLGH